MARTPKKPDAESNFAVAIPAAKTVEKFDPGSGFFLPGKTRIDCIRLG